MISLTVAEYWSIHTDSKCANAYRPISFENGTVDGSVQRSSVIRYLEKDAMSFTFRKTSRSESGHVTRSKNWRARLPHTSAL